MSKPVLELLNVLFFVVHTFLILFNLFGWLVPRWRLANLITLSLTAFSWFVLGLRYGWGYCVCVDWHWQIRELLGYGNTSASYVHLLINKLTRIDLAEELVDGCTVVLFFAALFISSYLNIKKWKGN